MAQPRALIGKYRGQTQAEVCLLLAQGYCNVVVATNTLFSRLTTTRQATTNEAFAAEMLFAIH